ncbi:MAG: hypothetical protein CL916_14790 [Deltaproteobacteria bacterium]|nr:hypothetical protein [Deltaproteobacteria bacterium]
MFSLFTLFIACSSAEFDVSGTPDGSDFTAETAYWGNQFIVFLDQEIDCIDMWWVQTFNLQGEDPPTSRDLRALQITYNNEEEEIFEGTYTLGGEAPIKTEFLEITGETFNVSRAAEGILELDEKIEDKALSGGVNFVFSEGAISGTFTNITWCNNIK